MPKCYNTKSTHGYLLLLLFSEPGVPYNVTVFAINGKGKGPNVSKVAYAEEDGNQ